MYFEQTAPSLDNGARILRSIVRPYPAKTAGHPIRFDYEMTTGEFTYEWVTPEFASEEVSLLTARETEIYMPSLLTRDRKVIVQGLGAEDTYLHDESRQTLFILIKEHNHKKIRTLKVSLHPPLKAPFEVNDFVGDFGPQIFAGCGLVIGLLAFWILMLYDRG